MDLADFESRLGFTFGDKSLLTRALTHRSYLNENSDLPYLDNERLEFLGDAVLDFITAEYLYQRFPQLSEGDLTSLRAALVRGETLARFAIDLGLPAFLLISRGEDAAGGRSRAPLLAGAFEAILGALYLDQGLIPVRTVVARFILPESERILHERLDRDPKSLLQEMSQGQLQVTPHYRLVDTKGPDHAKEFTVQVVLGDQVYGQGIGRSKQHAEQEAARLALETLREEISRRDHATLLALRGDTPESSPREDNSPNR